MLANTDQLMSLLGTFKAGDQVDLSYFRKGKLALSKVTLEERAETQPTSFEFSEVRQNLNKSILNEHGIIARIIPAEGMKIKDVSFNLDLKLLDGVEPKVMMEHILKKMIRYNDEHGTCTLKQTEKGLHLNAQDKDGNELFNGPIEPESEWEKIPANIQPGVRKMKKLLNITNKKLSS